MKNNILQLGSTTTVQETSIVASLLSTDEELENKTKMKDLHAHPRKTSCPVSIRMLLYFSCTTSKQKEKVSYALPSFQDRNLRLPGRRNLSPPPFFTLVREPTFTFTHSTTQSIKPNKMPKVSRVGKFRKAAADAAVVGSSKSPATKTRIESFDGKTHHDAMGEQMHVPSAKTSKSPEVQQKSHQNAASSDINPATETTTNKDTTALSRGQRKRQAKRDQYLRKETMILKSLKLHKEEEQKKRIDGLDALKEALMETAKASLDKAETREEKRQPSITSNKAKQQILASELNHMSLVLQHPSFQQNPFEAMQAHLRNTLAKQGKEQQVASVARVEQEKKAAVKRKEDKKERLRNVKGKKKSRSKFKATRSRGGK